MVVASTVIIVVGVVIAISITVPLVVIYAPPSSSSIPPPPPTYQTFAPSGPTCTTALEWSIPNINDAVAFNAFCVDYCGYCFWGAPQPDSEGNLTCYQGSSNYPACVAMNYSYCAPVNGACPTLPPTNPPPPPSKAPYPKGYLQRPPSTAKSFSAHMWNVNNATLCPTLGYSSVISWAQIVQYWQLAGGLLRDCPAALVIIGGEVSGSCELTGKPATGCSNYGGIMQAYGFSNISNNLCADVAGNTCCQFATVLEGYIYNIANPGGVGCLGSFQGGFDVPDYVPTTHSGMGMNQTQPNFIGPFCHAGGNNVGFPPGTMYEPSSLQSAPDGTVWGGGQAWMGCTSGTCGDLNKVLFPFPWQYYGWFVSLFNSSCNMNDLSNPNTACFCGQPTSGVAMSPELAECFQVNIVQQAVNIAQGLCHANWVSNLH